MRSTTVTIETPKGSTSKYAVDPASGEVRLVRELFTALAYPANHGYIQRTITDGGRPLDAFVLLRDAVFPGVTIDVRVIGAALVEDRRGLNAKIVSVPADDPRWKTVQSIEHVAHDLRMQIEHFLLHDKDLAPRQNRARIKGWADAEHTRTLVDLAQLRFARESGGRS